MAGGIPQFLNEIKDKPNWNVSGVLAALDRAGIPPTAKASEVRRGIFTPPDVLKVGDIISTKVVDVDHPSLVFKIEEDAVHYVVFSTTQSPRNLYKIKNSRHFNKSYVTTSVATTSIEGARKRWIGEFDSPKEIKDIVKALRKAYYHILSTGRGKKKKEERFVPIDFDKEDFGNIDEID